MLRFSELELDQAAHLVRIRGRTVELTPIEYRLLELFMLHPGQVLPPKLIYDHVWGYDFGLAGNTLRVYIGYLRRKLEHGGGRRLIQTIYGRGYVLREPSGACA